MNSKEKFFLLNFLEKNKLVLLKSLGLTLSALSLGVFSLYYFQNRLIYLPCVQGLPQFSKENIAGYRSPSERNLPYEEIKIKTEDEILLYGWFIKQKSIRERPTIVYFHENAGNLGTRMDFLTNYYKLANVNILLVAYRGYDQSEGKPSELGIQKDSEAILKYIFSRDDIDKKRIFTHGRSLGGATSLYGVSHSSYPVAGMILENTFTSMENVVNHLIPKISIFTKMILKNKWKSDENIQKIHSPILFIKSGMDDLIPCIMIDQLREKAIKSKFIHTHFIELGDHNANWMIDKDEYFRVIFSFIKKVTELQNPNL